MAQCFGFRPSHFCLFARKILAPLTMLLNINLATSAPEQALSLRESIVFLISKLVCSTSRLAPGNLPSPSPARTPALESSYRRFMLQCICANPFVLHVPPSSVFCRGLSFQTPQLKTDLVYARHGRFRVDLMISHGFR